MTSCPASASSYRPEFLKTRASCTHPGHPVYTCVILISWSTTAWSIDKNIIGTANIVKYCYKHNKRLVYISTDYIYPGDKGNYSESDAILPYNEYAWTKLGGECSVILLNNYLIIRTSFGNDNFPYEQAWENQIVSKDYIDIIAPKILKASISDVKGILNIGTHPKTMFEYASKRNNVKKALLNNKTNFSLNINKYEQLFSN